MRCKLKDFCTVINGRAYSQKELLDKGKYRVLRVGNFFSSDRWYFSDLELPAEKYCNKGDLLFAWACSFGPRIWDGEDRTIFHYHIWKLDIYSAVVDKKYLYYLLKISVESMTAGTHGSVMMHITKSDMENFEFDIPTLEVQKKIAAILSALDEKIAINRAINENLERQAKEYFKSLFIDFAAYNGEFVDSPIGLIPATMEIDQISNIPHTLETGKRPKGGAVEKGVPSIGAENVKQLGVVDFSSAKFIPEEFAFSMKRGRIYGYEVLLYKDGGKPGTFIPHFSMFGEGFPYETCFINEHVFKLDFGHRGYNEFCYLYLQTDYPFHWLANNGGKAAVPGINQQDVNDIWIPTIHNESVKKFCEWVQPIFTTILSNCSENVKLANIRDSLLSRLLSGEIDVSEIEF